MDANSSGPKFDQVVAETQLIFELAYSHGVVFAAAFRMEFGTEVAAVLSGLAGDSPGD